MVVVCTAAMVTACTTTPADGCVALGSSATRTFHLNASDDGNSRAIQAAIDDAAALGGGIIQLSSGQFDIHAPLLLKDNIALRGAGPATVLKASPRFLSVKGPHGGHPLVTTEGAHNITIAALTADQSGDELDGNVEGRLNEYLIDVRHSTNALVDAVSTRNPFTYSIAVVGSRNFCVRDSTTVAASSGRYDQLDGVHITDSNTGVVVGNRVDQGRGEDGDDGLVAQTIGSEVYDVVFRNNDVRGGPHGAGMQLAVSGHAIRNITIKDNWFWGSPSGIRTGYYEGGVQPVAGISVVGNTFRDNRGNSIAFTGELENIRVVDNRICRSGGIDVHSRDGASTVENNRESCRQVLS